MNFTPVVPLGGLAGWAFLKRTGASQQAAYAASAATARETERFAQGIAGIRTAEELVGDRQLLKVALGAFGLDSDIDNRYFVRRILEEGTTERTALANKLTDKRYAEMARAFGFDSPLGPATARLGFAERIVAAYEARGFEEAVGEQDPAMRLALNLERELPTIAGRDVSDSTRWFTIMGTPPLRQVFETAFGLPRILRHARRGPPARDLPGQGAVGLRRRGRGAVRRSREARGADADLPRPVAALPGLRHRHLARGHRAGTAHGRLRLRRGPPGARAVARSGRPRRRPIAPVTPTRPLGRPSRPPRPRPRRLAPPQAPRTAPRIAASRAKAASGASERSAR